jgi:hypothetical protein
MKIELKVGKDYNGSEIHEVIINENVKESVRIHDLSECPEDAHIGRDLIDGRDIIAYIQMGYRVAKLGQELEIIESKLED